jgi:hypothetical protein
MSVERGQTNYKGSSHKFKSKMLLRRPACRQTGLRKEKVAEVRRERKEKSDSAIVGVLTNDLQLINISVWWGYQPGTGYRNHLGKRYVPRGSLSRWLSGSR